MNPGQRNYKVISAEKCVRLLRERCLLHVAEKIAVDTGVPLLILLGPGKAKSVMGARRQLYRALRLLSLSLHEIGGLLDRDHTTVIWGLRPPGARTANLRTSTKIWEEGMRK